MTKAIANDIMPVMARTQLQIDITPRLRNKLKVLAYTNEMTLRELVFRSLARVYPHLAQELEEELSRQAEK